MDDAAASDDVNASWVDEARGQDVEVVGDTVGDNRVSSVIAALSAAAKLGFVGEDVGELALAFVAPLGAEDNGDRHGRESRRGGERRDETRREWMPGSGVVESDLAGAAAVSNWLKFAPFAIIAARW